MYHTQKGAYTMPDKERKGQLGDDWTRVSLPIEKDLYRDARVAAAMRGESTVAFIRDAIRAALDQQPQDKRLASLMGVWDRLWDDSRDVLYRVAAALEAMDKADAGKGE